jgi:hypothetical protein
MYITGVGMQFLTLATGIIIMAMLGMFNVHRHGQINSAGVILYAFTSCKYLLYVSYAGVLIYAFTS